MREGHLVAGRFELERLARTGGAGSVYRAIDRQLGKRVALKLMHPGTSGSDRFAREARLLADLSHPAIVRYVAHGQTPDGSAFLAMEWLEGEDLGERLGTVGRLDVAETLGLARRIAEGLGMAHARGVVHRDVKPGNIFLPNGDLARAKLLDFGVAGLTYATRRITRTGIPIGTPSYMAPEQARGERSVDNRADVFSLGCVLFECLAGRPAFAGRHWMAVLAKVLFDEAEPLADIRNDVPEGLARLIASMLAKDPDARPPDAQAVARRIARLQEDPAARSIDTARPPALGREEQRLVTVVVAGRADPSSDDTIAAAAIPELPDTARFAEAPPRERLETARARLAPYDARVDMLADGSIVAVLAGSGQPTEVAGRAARSALVLREILPDVPIVVATGRGVVSQRLPTGEAIDRAVRGLDGSRASAIVVDDDTAGMIEARFEVRRTRDAWELAGERAIASGARTLLGKPSPCVGRQRELGLLEATWQSCVDDPSPCAVLVTAPAGVGKSRIRHEIVERVERRDPDAEVLMARGDPVSSGSAFGMLAPAIRRAAGIVAGEPIAAQREKMLALAGRHRDREPPRAGASGLDVQLVGAFLGEIAGVPFPDDELVPLRAARADARLMGDQLSAAWLDWLDGECRAHPVLLVLEDIHWADLPTVQRADEALAALADRPFMVLALGRPEVRDRFPSLWDGRDVTEIRLGGLAKRAAEELVRSVLGDGAPDGAVQRIVDRAEGNALYLEELIRAQAAGAGAELPPTVFGMVQARLDALDPEGRRVLRAASIFGSQFWEGGVRALVGGDDRGSQISEWLDELRDREIVTVRDQSQITGERELAFRHDLVREAAYTMLTDDDRRLGHRLAAQWLAQRGDADAAVLAEHFERGGDRLRAADQYAKAAGAAAEANDLDGAVRLADRAIQCGASDEVRGTLRLLQAEARRWHDALVEAEALATEALTFLGTGSAPWFRAAGEAATLGIINGSDARLREWTERLETTSAGDDEAQLERVVALCRTAGAFAQAGERERAERLLVIAEVAAAEVSYDLPLVVARLERSRAAVMELSGDRVGALPSYDAAHAAFVRAGDQRNACLEQIYASATRIDLGDVARAETSLEDALEIAERMHLDYLAASAALHLGRARMSRGALAEAAGPLQRAAEWFRNRGGRRLESLARAALADVLRSTGEVEAAEAEASAAVARAGPFFPARAGALAALSGARLARGDVAGALEAARSADAIGEGAAGSAARVKLALVRALRANGERDTADAALRDALALVRAAAERIHDEAARARFLEAVPENAAIVALARERAIA